MRTLVLLLAGAAFAFAQSDEFILKAMKDEMQRSKALHLPGLEAPYFTSYEIEDADIITCSASLGALLSEGHTPLRVQSVKVRVGDYNFDNENYVYSNAYSGARYDAEELPLETNYLGLRDVLWLATDRAFKTAEEGIARKKSALKNVSMPDALPDFTKAAPTQAVLPASRKAVDQAAWKKRIIDLSAIFASYPAVETSSVEFQSVQSTDYLVNSEGTEIRTPDDIALVRTLAYAQAKDGTLVRDAEVVKAWDSSGLPPVAELRRSVTRAADTVTALAAAPQGYGYTGPILFEGEAAAELFGQVLGDNIKLQRKPVPEPGRPVPFVASELEGRLGAHILPDWMDVVDDPTQTEFAGKPLLGFYKYDLEGVPARPVTIVEKGTLKDFLRTRTPVLKGIESGSNGHGRLPGTHGATAPGIGNLFVRASQTMPEADMKKKLLEICKQRNKPYCMIVRKLDWPSTASIQELRRSITNMMMSGGGRPVTLPLLVYRVTPDGKEELVRGLRFRGFSTRSFRDIMAASDQPYVFNYMDSLAPFAVMGGAEFITNSTIIAPSVLIDDVELEQVLDETPNLPIIPPPPLVTN